MTLISALGGVHRFTQLKFEDIRKCYNFNKNSEIFTNNYTVIKTKMFSGVKRYFTCIQYHLYQNNVVFQLYFFYVTKIIPSNY